MFHFLFFPHWKRYPSQYVCVRHCLRAEIRDLLELCFSSLHCSLGSLCSAPSPRQFVPIETRVLALSYFQAHSLILCENNIRAKLTDASESCIAQLPLDYCRSPPLIFPAKRTLPGLNVNARLYLFRMRLIPGTRKNVQNTCKALQGNTEIETLGGDRNENQAVSSFLPHFCRVF